MTLQRDDAEKWRWKRDTAECYLIDATWHDWAGMLKFMKQQQDNDEKSRRKRDATLQHEHCDVKQLRYCMVTMLKSDTEYMITMKVAFK